jgi:hypothetical protein
LRFLVLDLFQYIEEPSQVFHLLDLDILQGEAHPNQHFLYDRPVVALEEDLLVLGRAPAGAFRLEGGREFV